MIKELKALSASINEAVSSLKELLPGERCAFGGLYGSSRAFLLAKAFREAVRPMLAVLASHEEARDFAGDLSFFLGPECGGYGGAVRLLPEREELAFEPLAEHPEITAGRLSLLYGLTLDRPFITVTTAANLAARLIPKDILKSAVIELEITGEYPRDALLASLTEAGYRRMEMVEERGELSVRGGIVDIFPPNYKDPIRLEFFGDDLESIRPFDLVTQRSSGELLELLILPASEAVANRTRSREARERLLERSDDLGLSKDSFGLMSDALRDGVELAAPNAFLSLFYEELDSIFDYLPSDTLVVTVDPHEVLSEISALGRDIEITAERLVEDGKFFVEPDSLYLDEDKIKEAIEGFAMLDLAGPIGLPVGSGVGGPDMEVASNFDIKQDLAVKKGADLFKPLSDRIRANIRNGSSVYITAHNKGQAERTAELLESYDLSARIVESGAVLDSIGSRAESADSATLRIVCGSLSTGFRFAPESGGPVLITEEEIFGERVKRRVPPAKGVSDYLAELKDLSEGDAIVHVHHGISVYGGLKRIEVEDVKKDFLVLEYKDSDRLYLPVERMDLVTKYHGTEGRAFEVDKLGGTAWTTRKKRVKKAALRIAAELLKLYAEREIAKGFAYSPSCHIYSEFEASFEYTETPDQARAIEDTIADMESERPMDRLICGDVGYGKTEVAMRAAFKAVLDGKQVAILVPTTVLADQHFRTFTERFAPYPAEVDVLSRFKTKAEQKEVLEKVRAGSVDIVIGTHRLLGADVDFKDLGLLVIDEEHRFGVRHKEKLKRLRKDVDVLTLTATPIPRTLQMSLASIRDLSIIATPPEDRLAIKTTVTALSDQTITEAITRELKRGGQVFFVHNRVDSIMAMADHVRGLVPEARVVAAHGQMKEHELEKKMVEFVAHDCDVLVCTTIIESGLDIPSANTIIINRADRFGLAELYQLRGRVGRSNHRAYAYLFCPPDNLTSLARKRLAALTSLTDAGAGFRVASFDLEIRGSGELLGSAQSGKIAEVGFEMYTRLLEESVAELKGEPVEESPEPEIVIGLSRYIPDDYVPDTRQRLSIYKRLATARDVEELDHIRDELDDRYGTTPELVLNLIRAAEIKILLKKTGAVELKQLGKRIYLNFGTGSAAAGILERALELATAQPRSFSIRPDSRFVYIMKDAMIGEGGADGEAGDERAKGGDPIHEARYLLKKLLD